MNKYYVQSGDIKNVIMAKSTFDACLTSLHKCFDREILLSLSFIVSERGFVLDRDPFWIDTSEYIYSSKEVMSEYIKWVD